MALFTYVLRFTLKMTLTFCCLFFCRLWVCVVLLLPMFLLSTLHFLFPANRQVVSCFRWCSTCTACEPSWYSHSFMLCHCFLSYQKIYNSWRNVYDGIQIKVWYMRCGNFQCVCVCVCSKRLVFYIPLRNWCWYDNNIEIMWKIDKLPRHVCNRWHEQQQKKKLENKSTKDYLKSWANFSPESNIVFVVPEPNIIGMVWIPLHDIMYIVRFDLKHAPNFRSNNLSLLHYDLCYFFCCFAMCPKEKP